MRLSPIVQFVVQVDGRIIQKNLGLPWNVVLGFDLFQKFPNAPLLCHDNVATIGAQRNDIMESEHSSK
jgi:hypothetical protein